MIEPTIGRNIYYITHPGAVLVDEDMVQHSTTKPFLAFITYVWSTTCVNLLVVDHEGNTHRRGSVPINTGTPSFPRAEWMDYQKGQAAKTQEVAAALEKAIAGQIDHVVKGHDSTTSA